MITQVIQKIIFIIFLLLSMGKLYSQVYWQEILFPDSIEMNDIICYPNDDLFLATSHGIYKSSDEGLNWEICGSDQNYVPSMVVSPNGNIYAKILPNFYRSEDQCITWSLVHESLSYLSIVIPAEDTIIIGDWGNISRSTDGGITFTTVLDKLEVFYAIIEINGVLYAGSTDYFNPEGGGVYQSTDSGATWVNIGLAGSGVSSLAEDEEGKLLAGCKFTASQGVHSTTLPEVNWQWIYNGNEVDKVLVDPFGGIYAGLQGDFSFEWGIRYSPDDGNTWEDFSGGLEEYMYTDELIISNNQYLFTIAADGDNHRKFYRTINPAVNVPEVNARAEIGIYPNPFRTSVNVCMTSENSKESFYEITDQTGRVIQSGYLRASSSQKYDCQTISLEHQPSGIYLLKIIKPEATVAPILLIKSQ